MSLLSWNESQILMFFLVLLRVSSLMIFMPIYGENTVLPAAKVLLSVALSWVIFPFIPSSSLYTASQSLYENDKLILLIFKEITFGLSVGFVCRWIFDATQFAGQLIGTSMGLSMASIVDPNTETQTMPIAQIKYALTLLLFLAADGHLILLKVMAKSFEFIPVHTLSINLETKSMSAFIMKMTAEIISISIRIAAPIISIIFIVNITFGLVSRAVPQMNVFAVSFSANIIIGLFVVLFNIPAFTNVISSSMDSYSDTILNFMRLFSG